MFSNRLFHWLAVVVIIYVILTNRGNLTGADKKEEPRAQPNISAPEVAGAGTSGSGGTDGEKSQVISQPLSQEEKQIMEMKESMKMFDSSADSISVWDIMNGTIAMKYGVVIRDIQGSSSEGDGVLCGEEATIHYTLRDSKNNRLSSTRDGEALTFRLGEGKVIKGIENGIIGMKKGAIRKLTIPAILAFDDPQFSDKGPKGTKIVAEVELLDSKTVIDRGKGQKMPLRIYNDNMMANLSGSGVESSCGVKATVNYKISDMEGNVIVNSFEEATPQDENTKPDKTKKKEKPYPLVFKTGEGTVPLAIETAVVGDGDKLAGMMVTAKRMAIAPVYSLKDKNGKSMVGGVNLPQKTLLMEIELVNIE